MPKKPRKVANRKPPAKRKNPRTQHLYWLIVGYRVTKDKVDQQALKAAITAITFNRKPEKERTTKDKEVFMFRNASHAAEHQFLYVYDNVERRDVAAAKIKSILGSRVSVKKATTRKERRAS